MITIRQHLTGSLMVILLAAFQLTAITRKAEIPLPEIPGNIFINGTMLYVACHDSGLRVFDVSDATAPVEAGRYDSTSRQEGFYDIVVSGDYAYCARGGDGIDILDIHDPAAITHVDRVTDQGGEALAYNGGIVYTVNNRGLHIYDVSDIGASEYIAGWYVNPDSSTYEPGIGIALTGTYACIAFEDSGLHIVDIATPASPVVTGSYHEADGFRISAVAAEGNHVYLSTAEEGVKIIDITDPTAPALAGEYHNSTGGDGWDVACSGTTVYLLYQEWGVYIVDASTPDAPSFVAKYPSGMSFNGDYRCLAVNGTMIYAYYNESTVIYVLDATDDLAITHDRIPSAPSTGHPRLYGPLQPQGALYIDGFNNTAHGFCSITLFTPAGKRLSRHNQLPASNGKLRLRPLSGFSSGKVFYTIRTGGNMFSGILPVIRSGR